MNTNNNQVPQCDKTAVISCLSNKKKTDLFRMVYWKSHYDGIPLKEYEKLKEDGWLIKTNGGYTWSDESERISGLINSL